MSDELKASVVGGLEDQEREELRVRSRKAAYSQAESTNEAASSADDYAYSAGRRPKRRRNTNRYEYNFSFFDIFKSAKLFFVVVLSLLLMVVLTVSILWSVYLILKWLIPVGLVFFVIYLIGSCIGSKEE